MTRRLIACGLLVLASVTACGTRTADTGSATLPTSTPSSTASPAAAAGESAAAPAVKRCDATVLKGAVEPTDAGAGNRYGKFVVTNSSTAPCTLNGYSGFQLQTADGTAVPTKLERKADPGPKAISLAPGAKAVANLHWSVVPGGNEPVGGMRIPARVSTSRR